MGRHDMHQLVMGAGPRGHVQMLGLALHQQALHQQALHQQATASRESTKCLILQCVQAAMKTCAAAWLGRHGRHRQGASSGQLLYATRQAVLHAHSACEVHQYIEGQYTGHPADGQHCC